MRVIRWLLILVVVLAGLAAALALGARFHDGPLAMLPGGPFRSGEWVRDPHVDWSFATAIREVQLQSSGRSRTTWVLVLDGQGYIPCSLDFPPGKRWYREALEQPDAVVRIEGKLYRVRLERVDDPALRERLAEAAKAKYIRGGRSPVSDPSRVWYFHLAPPA